jgi:ABC-type multidrug transport system ATPase subunit/pSer/pThr/pTyr-binding forkhead associated (FHA) protein
MKIVLAEENGSGEQKPEQSFNQGVIRIGRDAFECDIPFDNARYPMVSRKHAELRFQDGLWILIDLNSTCGTFVDGNKISAPENLSVASRLQFGQNGPVLRVVWFEIASDSARNFSPPENYSKNSFQNAPVSAREIAPTPFAAPQNIVPKQIAGFDITPKPAGVVNQPDAVETPQLEFIGENTPPFKLDKQSVSLGRDPNCDIRFDASVVVVSRRHAEIKQANDTFIVYDNGSFNGTLINEQRISAPTPLYHDDEIQLGIGGPLLRFDSPRRVAPKGASLAGQRSIAVGQLANLPETGEKIGSKTMVFKADNFAANIPSKESAQPQLLMSLTFGGKKELIIGRSDASDIKLDGLQISNRHARLLQTNAGIAIEDSGSTNGVYINGKRISRQVISPSDAVQIGSFLIQIDSPGNIGVFDTRSKTRIDAVGITKNVKNRAGGGQICLLDNVSLVVQPNEFVGLLGPSGAGKSTLMDAMNGMRPASIGSVLINNLDFYSNLDALKQSIGYVPQDDIIHRELTVYRTLFYVAKLRLSGDVSKQEINQIIDEVLDVTGLSERRNVPVGQLSGGQRKRVSIAVELITKPSVIFLDEPTSGLDPATEEKIMRLFRQIAESGRTVVLTTHAMENVKLFDKIVVLIGGKLAFYGTPDEALKYLNAKNFKELYDRLEEPIEQKVRQSGDANRRQITEQTAEEWKQKFLKTPQYKQNIYEPLKQLGAIESGGATKKNRLGVSGAIRQFLTLSRRYAEVLSKDKLNLFILFAQAPIIAFLTFFVMGANQPRDFVYFVLSLVAVWFGTSVSAREIVREKPVYQRERMVNLGILPYLASKLFVLGVIVGLQCVLLFIPLKFFDLIGAMAMPGEWFGIPQFWTMILTAGVGIALGLLVSALVKTSEMATSLVPLILIPQILFSGLVGVPGGISKAISLTMPAAWSFDTMKRFSTLDTLEAEGAEPNGKTRGLGLYKYIETENEKIIARAKNDLEEYKTSSEEKLKDFEANWRNGQADDLPTLSDPPKIAAAEKIPENLSRYVTFLHPWMHEILNQIVLMIMFFILFITTLIVLRLKDIS